MLKSGSVSSVSTEIRGVILDYGEVICLRPAETKIKRLAEALQLAPADFLVRYHKNRSPYDQGITSPSDYWQDVAGPAAHMVPSLLAQLRDWDVDLWSELDPVMIRWIEQLQEAGYKTALLSNMHADMATHVRRAFEWISRLDVPILSCELKIVKPSAEIYTRTVEKLGLKPQEALFIDDRLVNVEAGQKVGLNTIHFASVEQLRKDLASMGFPVLP